jgi:hypothetical protein
MLSNILGANQFDQCVINMALIHLCNQDGHVGQEIRKLYQDWSDDSHESLSLVRRDRHQFRVFVPHPNQQYDGVTLEEGLSKGFNIEVDRVEERSQIPYEIPRGSQFVVVLKQKGLDGDFAIAATGIFVRPLAILSLDIIVDAEKSEYQSIVIRHPIIRDYPTDWENKLRLLINQEISSEDLPNLVNYVDQAFNPDYRPPSWQEVRLAANGFAGV